MFGVRQGPDPVRWDMWNYILILEHNGGEIATGRIAFREVSNSGSLFSAQEKTDGAEKFKDGKR